MDAFSEELFLARVGTKVTNPELLQLIPNLLTVSDSTTVFKFIYGGFLLFQRNNNISSQKQKEMDKIKEILNRVSIDKQTDNSSQRYIILHSITYHSTNNVFFMYLV